MSKSKRKVTVEGGKTDDSEKRKPSVFERLGPGAASRAGEPEEKHKCRNWLLYGSCKYGDRCIHEHGPFTSGKTRRKSRHGDGSDDGESPDKHRHKSKHHKGKERGHRSDSASKSKKDSDKGLKSQVSVKAGHEDDDSASGDSPFDDLDFNDELRLEQKRQELERQLRQLQPSDHEDERENIPVPKKLVAAESSGSELEKDSQQKKHHKTPEKTKAHKKAKKKKKTKGLKFLKNKSAAQSSDDSDEEPDVVPQPVEEPLAPHHRHYKKSSHKAEEYVAPAPPPPVEEPRHHHHHRHKDQPAPSAPPTVSAQKSDSDSANEQTSRSRLRKDRQSAGPTRVASVSPSPKKKKKVAVGRPESVEETDRGANQRYRKGRDDERRDSSDDDSRKARGRGRTSREDISSKDKKGKEEERRPPREDNSAVRKKRQQALSDDERRKPVKESVDRHRKHESIEVVKDSSSDDDEREKSGSLRQNRNKSDSKKRRRSSPEAREKSRSPPPANRGRQNIRERSADSSQTGDRRKQSFERAPRKPVVDMSPAKRDERNRGIKPSSPESRRPVKESNNHRQAERGERDDDRGERENRDKDNRDHDARDRDTRDHTRVHVRPSDSPDERILIEENRLRKEFGEAFAFARSAGRGPDPPPPLPGQALHIDERRGERIGPPPGFDPDHTRLDREGFGREPPPREPPPGAPFRFNDRDRGPPPPKMGRFEDGRDGPRGPGWEFERDRREGDWGRGPPPRDLPPPQRDPPPRDLPPRDLPPRDLPLRDLPPRDMPPRDLPPRDMPPRDLPPRDMPPRDIPPRDLPPRDSGGRDFPHPLDRGGGPRGYDEPPRSSDQHMSRRGDWDNRRARDDMPPERGFPGPLPVLAPEWIERHRDCMEERLRDAPDNQRFPGRRDEPEFFGELLDSRQDPRDIHPRGPLPLPPLLPPAEFHDQRDPDRRDGRAGDRRRDRPPSPLLVKEDDRSRDRREDSRKRGLEEPDRGRSPTSKKTRNESPTGSHRSRSSIARGDERERENRDRDRTRGTENRDRERETGSQRGGPRLKDKEPDKRDGERDRARERERNRDNERRDRDKDSRSDASRRTPTKDDKRFNKDSKPPDKVDSKSGEKKIIKEEEKADKEMKDASTPSKKDDKDKHKHKSRGKHGDGKKGTSKGESGKDDKKTDAEGGEKTGKKKSGSSGSSSSGSGSSGSESDSSSKSVESSKKTPKSQIKKEADVAAANEKKDDRQSVKSVETLKSDTSTHKKKGDEAVRGPDGKPRIAGDREVFSDWSTEDDVDDEILAMPENELAKQKQLAAGEAVPTPPASGIESTPVIKRPRSTSSIGSHRSQRSARSLRETERDSLKGSKSVSSGRRNSTEKTKDSTFDPEIASVKSVQNIDDKDSDDTGLLGNAMDLEAISDDEDMDWNDEHKEAQPVDALDLDWAGLMTEKPKTAAVAPATTSALSRFRASQVFQRIGVSRMFAGDALFQKLLDVCQKQVEEDAVNTEAESSTDPETKDAIETSSASEQKAKTKPVFELHHGIAAFHMAIVKKLNDREHLFHNVGPNRRALVARRDLTIRRQLCKVE